MRSLMLMLSGCISLALSSLCLAEGDLKPVPKEFQYCTVCHGTQMQGNPSTGAPRISGLPSWYIVNQLKSFQHSYRGTDASDQPGNEMRIAAEGITSDMLDDAAAFASATQSPLPAATLTGDATKGKALFATCMACHGDQAQGNEALFAPPLTGRNDWYLTRQLNNFLSGKRGAADGDVTGSQMAAAVTVLTDEQAVADVVAFIQTLN
ncbi:c-type cytochrome [Halioxenophilus sp. WMMB6]|uniref:c-type cytochrome n=1 Tax=Halioxenophilus sp. WMMB6 TaxID=3073815 RepID=UPI00295E3525|nr:c-type cytochrome [Halioxenophilus sp. WMMB6]